MAKEENKMSIIQELNKKYAEARVNIAAAERTAKEVLQKLEDGDYIIYSHCTSRGKFQLNLETSITEQHLAVAEIQKMIAENIFHDFSVTILDPRTIAVAITFYPSDRVDTPFDKILIEKIKEKFRAVINNNMMYFAEQGESSGHIRPGEDFIKFNLYASHVFDALAKEYREEGISLQFGIELADEVYFSWKPTDKEGN
jgi:hypothetical protein